LEQAEKVLDSGRGVFFAGNAEKAKQLLRTVGAGFSVVMVDLDLPGQDGFSLIAEVRKNYPDLPIIAISSVLQREILESAKFIGATDTLQKPISPEWNARIALARAKAA
jgi:two-component system response regulator FlrC